MIMSMYKIGGATEQELRQSIATAISLVEMN